MNQKAYIKTNYIDYIFLKKPLSVKSGLLNTSTSTPGESGNLDTVGLSAYSYPVTTGRLEG